MWNASSSRDVGMVWVVVLTGVCGSGKSTIGRALADKENAQFVDGDDYHSRENVKKMSSGQPLTDQDRIPWLESLHQVLYEWVHDRVEGKAEGKMRGVLACSALKRNYRDLLTGRGQGVRDISQYCILVQLTAGLEVLAGRMAQRNSHFMPSSLLTSQLAVLEPLGPAEGACLTCQTTATVDSVVENIQHFLLSLLPPISVVQ